MHKSGGETEGWLEIYKNMYDLSQFLQHLVSSAGYVFHCIYSDCVHVGQHCLHDCRLSCLVLLATTRLSFPGKWVIRLDAGSSINLPISPWTGNSFRLHFQHGIANIAAKIKQSSDYIAYTLSGSTEVVNNSNWIHRDTFWLGLSVANIFSYKQLGLCSYTSIV